MILTTADWIIIGAYFLLSLVIGILVSKKSGNSASDQPISFGHGPEENVAEKRIYFTTRCTDKLYVIDHVTDPIGTNVAIFEAVDYSNAGYPLMLNQIGLPDFMDGPTLAEVPLEITATENSCGQWTFEAPSCYENWTVSWSFGDGTFDNSDHLIVTHNYSVAGGFGVTLTATMNGLNPQYATVTVSGCLMYAGSTVLPLGTTPWTNISCIRVQSDIEIPAGANLIIDNCTVKFAEDKRLIVQPGGSLIILNGSHLTACEGTWGGIWAKGNPQSLQDGTQANCSIFESEISLAECGLLVAGFDMININSFLTSSEYSGPN